MIRPLSSVLHEKGGKRNSPDPERSVWGYFSDPTRVRLKSYPLAPAACQASRRGPQRLPSPPSHPLEKGRRAGPINPSERIKEREENTKLSAQCRRRNA